ncbi:MAG TPA: agmatine deiminase family protein [Terriglobales bacterium]|nr:agmatine deiminase family protein [Terriglobales bacterium]
MSSYRMPAEWAPHAATWLAWPHERSDWPGKFQPIPWVVAEIVRYLARQERVELIVQDEAEERRARSVLSRADALIEPNKITLSDEGHGVRFHRWPTDRMWLRDSGAIFTTRQNAHETGDIKDGELIRPLDFRFNAWAKYDNWKLDNRIPLRVANVLKLKTMKAETTNGGKPYHFVLEGGSIDTNGQGALLTTEECLLSPVQQRNPGLTREQIEQTLCQYLGLTKVIWLDRGVVGDDTHGHVDDITRFVADSTVVTVVEPNKNDLNHEPLAENLRRLKAATDQDGRKLNIVELPMPSPVIFRGQRLPASYANFYIANGVVLVPIFNDPNDRVALNILAELFSTREVVGIYCRDLVWGLGTIHCMSQQQPAV